MSLKIHLKLHLFILLKYKYNISFNKYELLCKINQVYALNKKIIPVQGPKNINKVLVDTRREFDFNIGDYNQQLVALRNFT